MWLRIPGSSNEARVSPLARSFSTRLVCFCPRSSSSNERASGPLSAAEVVWQVDRALILPPGRGLTLKVTPTYVLNAIRHCKIHAAKSKQNTGHVSNGGAELIFTKSHASTRTTALSLTLYHPGRRPRATRSNNNSTICLKIKNFIFSALFWK